MPLWKWTMLLSNYQDPKAIALQQCHAISASTGQSSQISIVSSAEAKISVKRPARKVAMRDFDVQTQRQEQPVFLGTLA